MASVEVSCFLLFFGSVSGITDFSCRSLALAVRLGFSV